MTIALTTNNVDSRTKFPPFVMHKYARLHAFTRKNISNLDNLNILWNSNSKAWKIIVSFQRILLGFEWRMRLGGEDEVLL